jgi:D-3-phosphoglycerate dehydrogenase / 2-oxoglutarate reductase
LDLKQCRLLVTPTSYGKNDLRLKTELAGLVGEVIYNPTGKPLRSPEVAALLPGVDGYIAGVDVIDRAALRNADRLKVISRYGVGLDSVDLRAAAEQGIVVTCTPGANAVSVAELAVGLLLSLARQIPEGAFALREGSYPRLGGVSLEGRTVGIIGLGAIGKEVTKRLRGFDCRLLAYDPAPSRSFADTNDVELVPLDDLLSQSDFVSLHLPLLPETQGLVNRAFLSKMKMGAFLINTARGEIVEESALLEALQSGHLRGAALDVFAVEPPSRDNPLLALKQVVATPHLGSQTDSATNRMGWMALRDCLAVLRGEEPEHRVA